MLKNLRLNLMIHNKGVREAKEEYEKRCRMRDQFIKVFVMGTCQHEDIVRVESTDAVGKDVRILMCTSCGCVETDNYVSLDLSRSREVSVKDCCQLRRDIDLRLQME